MSQLEPLIDTFGRVHNNLRISVTDRCNIRCFYCSVHDKWEGHEINTARFVQWENSNIPRVINQARAEIARCVTSRKIELGELAYELQTMALEASAN